MDQPPQDPTQPTQPAPEQPAAPAGWAQPAPPASGPAWGQPAPTQPAPPAQPGPAWGQPPAPPQYAPPPQAYAPPPQQYAPPQQAPAGWAAQPAPTGSQWVQPPAVKGPVTTLARLGGLLVAVIGALWIFFGAILIIGGAVSKGFLDSLNTGTDVGNAIGGAIAVVGIIIVVIAVFELIAGLAAVFGKDWGRVVSIIYSFVFGVPLLLITISAATATRNSGITGSDATGGLIFLGAHVVAYAFAAIVLMARWRGRASA